ncbi:uncharacterized protein LOC119073834 [Bradysia coprophila]|uniref:uncharacterized protein LOC119073834 n=1 Tax=Bradysia coprophila TaxID=38358 RepID=UPI00187DB958|nr:uncharacterized protein LOC119073834 [Bradysia coprophila]
MLKNLIDSAERNCSRKKHGYRHDNTTKKFAAFIKMISGLLAYETLHANFPLSLPSVSTVNRYISDNGPDIIEGKLRTDELLYFLESRNLPLVVSLSEDATRITAKISYDPNTNQLVGFAPPLDENGMPITFSFAATNATVIQKHFNNSSNFMSSTVYVQMAQPMAENISPFCLMVFLTDSTFTSANVYRRWKYQAEQLKQKAIRIENIATDGDPRPLKAMKCLSRIGNANRLFLDSEWFSCGGSVETTFTQDTIHIVTKARNRLLTYSRIFPIGSKIISQSHLKYLIDHVSKDKHLMVRSDIEPKDRQNFLSAEKICSDKVIQCLIKYVPGSEGTVLYLKAVNRALNAYMNVEITSTERIYMMWCSVFFFRAWRSWILNSAKSKTTGPKLKAYYNLKDNFISSNCYTCIEINAHALVKKLMVDNSEETPSSHCFIPDLYSSQPCEATFRQVRSFTSTYSTIVNCSMLEIIHRIKKVQLQNDIINESKGEIQFPRFEKKETKASNRSECYRIVRLGRQEIIAIIEKSKATVTSELNNLQIGTSKLDFHCQITPVTEADLFDMKKSNDELDSDSDESESNFLLEFDEGDSEPEEEIREDIETLSGITGELLLRDYEHVRSTSDVRLNEGSPFAIVLDNSGKEKVVRKSSICWLLSKEKFKLSCDRLQRVQEKEYGRSTGGTIVPSCDDYSVNEELSVGEWCVFYGKREMGDIEEDHGRCDAEDDEEDEVELIGLVVGFAYTEGKTFKDREYSKVSASVKRNSGRSVGMLCDSYTFNTRGELCCVAGTKHKYISIEKYIATIKEPTFENKSMTLSETVLSKLCNIV